MQQAEQQMVLPDAVDAEIAPRQALAAEAAFFQHPDRRRIGGDAGGLDAVKIELAEQRRQQYAQRRRHVAAMRMRLSDPVPDGAGLHDAADHRAIRFAEYDERIGSVGGDVFGIAAQPPPEAGAAQVVRWPDRLPWRQVFPAGFAQMRPLQKIGHLRRAQQKAMATRGKRGRPAGWQTKQGHVQYSLMPKPASVRGSPQWRRALTFARVNPSAKATAVSRPLPLPRATTAGRLRDNSPRAALRVDSMLTASIRETSSSTVSGRP